MAVSFIGGGNIYIKVKVCCLMTFSTYFSYIGQSILVEDTGVPGENHRLAASHWQTVSHNDVSSTPRHQRDSNSQL